MSSSRHRSRRNCMSTRNNMCNRRIKPTGTLVTVSLMCVTNTNTSVLDAVITDKPLEDFSLTACAHMSVTSDNAWEHEISKGLESIDSKRQQQRRRYAQQGTTAKNHARLFVQHDYHDRAQEARNEDSTTNCWEGGIMSKALFPAKLHCVLNDAVGNGWEHIISWAPHGRCFAIHNHKEFVVHVMPK